MYVLIGGTEPPATREGTKINMAPRTTPKSRPVGSAPGTSAPAEETPAAVTELPRSSKRIPVRITMVIDVDPDDWADTSAEQVSFGDVHEALIAAGLSEEAANRAAVAATSVKTDGTNAIRERVRQSVLRAVNEVEGVAWAREERRTSRSRRA